MDYRNQFRREVRRAIHDHPAEQLAIENYRDFVESKAANGRNPSLIFQRGLRALIDTYAAPPSKAGSGLKGKKICLF